MSRNHKKPKHPVLCPYCGKKAEKATGATIYPHRADLYEKRFYLCEPCDAYVGVHAGTWLPFGRLANAELREIRRKAHALFDPLWKKGEMTRGEAYGWLSRSLGITREETHIGNFDVAMCQETINAVTELKRIAKLGANTKEQE